MMADSQKLKPEVTRSKYMLYLQITNKKPELNYITTYVNSIAIASYLLMCSLSY